MTNREVEMLLEVLRAINLRLQDEAEGYHRGTQLETGLSVTRELLNQASTSLMMFQKINPNK